MIASARSERLVVYDSVGSCQSCRLAGGLGQRQKFDCSKAVTDIYKNDELMLLSGDLLCQDVIEFTGFAGCQQKNSNSAVCKSCTLK